MALHESCVAIVEKSMSSIVSVPEESIGELQDSFSKIQLSKVEIQTDITRQDSTESSCTSVKEEDETAEDDNDSCSDGGMETETRGQRSISVVSDASEEGGRDSGIESERDADMVVPDQDLMDRIVTQVEIYFSDSSVMKDKFLLKHIRRNKEGYVSLKLVSSFKKVKQLTKDWRVVAYALSKASTGIQINDLGTKIRRSSPLPEIDDTPVTCTILAMDLPLEKPGIDTVSQLFSKCGDMALIRVLRSGAALSADMKPLASKFPALTTKNCAWIEFEAPEAAKEACKLSSEEGMKVVPIVPESPKKTEKPALQHKNSNAGSRKNSNANFNFQKSGPNSRKTSLKHNMYRNESENKPHTPQRRKAISLPYNQRPNIRELNVDGRRRPKSKSLIEIPGQGSSSQHSWMQRHLFAAAAASAASAALPTSNKILKQRVSIGSLTAPEGVIRFPKGPDGSKGFGGQRFSDVINEKSR